MSPFVAVVLMNDHLRLHDNPALHAAATKGALVIPLFVHDTSHTFSRALGENQKWWLKESLSKLQESFKARGCTLVIRQGEWLKEVLAVVKQSQAKALFYNESFDPQKGPLLAKLKEELLKQNVEVGVGKADLLVYPPALKPSSGPYFKVFSPFWKKGQEVITPPSPLPVPSFIGAPLAKVSTEKTLNFLKSSPGEEVNIQWEPGEKGAHTRLKHFIKTHLAHYDEERDRLDLPSTSFLSPHLTFGELGIRALWQAVQEKAPQLPKKGVKAFVNEIGFKEFSAYLLFHFPALGTTNFREQYDAFPWEGSSAAFKAWSNGKTGYPVVDAGIRQLLATGWMHNRARLIVGSFLTKDLLIDWRRGERFFWEHLVDANRAINAFNWQWVAGSGADAAPYFRVFNPVLQGLKFDPHGEYVKRWVPELKNLPDKVIHTPWELDPEELANYGVRLGKTYPFPMVDHKEAKERALALYKQI